MLIAWSGKSEIRTREPLLEVTRFPGVPLQPLEHLSFFPQLSRDCKYNNIPLKQKKISLYLYAMKILIVLYALLASLSAGASPCHGNKVILGDERLGEYLKSLEGKRVAVFSNHSGIVGDKVEGSRLADDVKKNGITDENSLIPFTEPSVPGGTIGYGPHLVDVLLGNGVDVRGIFSPEHGFRGTADAGENVASGRDEKTGIEILSLYEKGSRMPGKDKMDRFDVLLVDIQDVGLRYYTYYISMLHLMDACARYGKKVIVLDRPNPNGFYVDGPILDMEYKSGIGALPICTVHGMTLGELALMINGEGWLEEGRKCDLEVIPCLNYTHGTKYSLIVPPSPNLKDMKSVYLYSSTCYFEGTAVTAGRGTMFPFEVYGHPAMKGYPFSFVPKSIPGAKKPRYLGEECFGVDLRGKPLEYVWKEKINLEYVIDAWRALGTGDAFFMSNGHFELLAGVGWVRQMIESGCTAEEISARWEGDVRAFEEMRKPYLLYE